MPYDKVSELPDAVRDMPKHAQEIYMSAYNAAFKQYDGNEGKAHGTAWAAVKKQYKKVGDKWVAKEAIHPHGEHICYCPKCESEITVGEDVKCNTQSCPDCETQMRAKDIGERRESLPQIDVTEIASELHNLQTENQHNSMFIGKEVSADFSIPPYTSLDCLREKYTEIIQEAGKRNASLDSARLKKIVELCQELLSSEKEEGVEEALVEADSVLAWLKEQKVMKTEDGVQFPAEAYAYVPDSEKSSTWKLRLWEDTDKKITRAQLGRAAAALSPGGFRGQKVAIPSGDLSAVKRKIRAAYRALDVEDEEIPRWVREAETRELIQFYMPLTEAKFDKGQAQVIIIKPGFNTTEDRYYPAEVLKRDYGIFEGQKMYADHPTEEEDKARPERSIRDWVATLIEVKCDDDGVITGIAEIVEPWLMQKLASLRDKDMLSEMGISINAVGSASKGIIEGKETLVIEKLVAARSVDFVTEPGAGGVVTFYESDRSHDIDLVELSVLREKRPDLVKRIEADVRAEITKEVKKAMENEERVKELEGQIETLTTERDGLKEAAEKAEKDKAKAEAQAIIKEAVDKAELPDAAKERLIERFKDAESAEGIEEAIQSEVDYIAKLSEAGKVKGLGGSTPDPEKDKEALTESFKRLHPEWTEDQVKIAVEGR